MALADLRLLLVEPDGTTQEPSLRADRVQELLDTAGENGEALEDEDQALVIADWLDSYVREDGWQVCAADRPDLMDAIFAALRGIPLAEPAAIHLEPVSAPAPEHLERDGRELLAELRRHPALWVATTDLVRARGLVEQSLASDGWNVRTWTAAQGGVEEFIPGGSGRASPHDDFVAPLTSAMGDEPSEPTAYVFMDPNTDDASLEGRSTRQHFLDLAVKVANSRGRLRMIVLKSHADIPDRFRGAIHLHWLAFEGTTALLDRLGEDLTAKARRGEMQRIAGRDCELRQMIVILNEKANTPNVPLLLGNAGVGKTALVEELARQIASEDPGIPLVLRGRRILSLPASAFKGETPHQEVQRVEELKRELEVNRELVLLFIDEAHELMAESGGAEAQPAAVQQLKAGLARGLYPLILASTPEEGKRIEADPAFLRRSVPVYVDELPAAATVDLLMETRVPELCRVHHLDRGIDREAVQAAVNAAQWYLPDLARPAGPIRILSRAASKLELDGFVHLDQAAVWAAASDLLGRPVAPPSLEDERLWEVIDKLDMELRKRLVGQDQAFDQLRESLQSYLFRQPAADRKPHVWLFVGPPGCGKTESSTIISQGLFHAPPLIYDMAAYGQQHQAAELVGSPPGYVGSDRGARIVRDIRSRPCGQAVLLMDEFGRAHPDIPQRLMNVFDRGIFVDSLGRRGDFRDTIFILTSNDIMETEGKSEADLKAELLSAGSSGCGFDEAIVSRLDRVIAFKPLDHAGKAQIAGDLLGALCEQLRDGFLLDCSWDREAAAVVAKEATDQLGVRPMRERVRRLEGEAIVAYRRLRTKQLRITTSNGELEWLAK